MGWRIPLGGDGRPFIPFMPFTPFICGGGPGYPFGGDGRPFIPPRIDGLYGLPGDWLARLGKPPIGGGPPLYCSSSSRAAVSEFARESACIWPRSTLPYRFEEQDIRGSSMMLSCRLGTWLMTWLDRCLPKLGRNLLPRVGVESNSGFLRSWEALGGGALRFFLEVTLIMSKLSGSIGGGGGPEPRST